MVCPRSLVPAMVPLTDEDAYLTRIDADLFVPGYGQPLYEVSQVGNLTKAAWAGQIVNILKKYRDFERMSQSISVLTTGGRSSSASNGT